MKLLRSMFILAALALFTFAACDDNGDGTDGTGETPATGDATQPAGDATQPAADTAEPSGGLTITSSAFADGETIPTVYTCDGDNVSPPLSISGVPDEAQSLALIVDDPDAPGGSFIHWVVWNIDPSTSEIPEGLPPRADGPGGGEPIGVEGVNSGGAQFYAGPCPPSGTHRYLFQLFALDTTLDLDPATTGAAELLTAMGDHTVGKAQLTGTYSRE